MESRTGMNSAGLAEVGIQRVAASGGCCWLCGLPAVAGERLPGRRRGRPHRVRLLCRHHASAVFGPDALEAQ